MRILLLIAQAMVVFNIGAQTSKAQFIFSTTTKKGLSVPVSNKTELSTPVFSSGNKGVIEALNWVRQNPKEFVNRVLLNPGYENFVPAPERNWLYASLIADLNKMEPIKTTLIYSEELYGYALCHAKTSGEQGLVSHQRVNPACEKGFRAECISYGPNDPLEIIFNLLVDEGNPNLGHRKILTADKFTLIGVSIQPHSTYRYNCVIDLK